MAQVQTNARSENPLRPSCLATWVRDVRRPLNTALWIFLTPSAWVPSRDRRARQRAPAPRKFRPIAAERHFMRAVVEPPHTCSHRQSNALRHAAILAALGRRGSGYCGGGCCLARVLLAEGEHPTRVWRLRVSGPATDQTEGAGRREQQHGQSENSRGRLHCWLLLLRESRVTCQHRGAAKRPQPVE
jgi:hypothetical protein